MKNKQFDPSFSSFQQFLSRPLPPIKTTFRKTTTIHWQKSPRLFRVSLLLHPFKKRTPPYAPRVCKSWTHGTNARKPTMIDVPFLDRRWRVSSRRRSTGGRRTKGVAKKRAETAVMFCYGTRRGAFSFRGSEERGRRRTKKEDSFQSKTRASFLLMSLQRVTYRNDLNWRCVPCNCQRKWNMVPD